MIVYKTTNLVNGKIYIGKDIYDNPSYLGSGLIFRRALSKYGKHNFLKETLEKCSNVQELNEREKYWISFFNSTDKSIGYNIMDGGHGGNCHNYHYGPEHPYFGKCRPPHIGVAVANSNRNRPKVFGVMNKSYKSIPSHIKLIIIELSKQMGRDKIYKRLVELGITGISPRTITRRLHEWKSS